MSWNELWSGGEAAVAEIPTGVYTAILDDAGALETKEPASIMLKYKIVDGEFANRTLTHFHRWTDQSKEFIVKDLMRAQAKQCEDKLDAVVESFQGVIGKPLAVYVKPREYNGKTYYNVYVNGLKKDAEGNFGVDANDDF